MTSPVMATPPAFVPLGLTRDGAHVYSWNDGKAVRHPIPSVTTALGIINKPAVVGWVRRETAEFAVSNLEAIGLIRDETGHQSAVDFVKASTDRRRDKAADRGTNIHQIAEQIVRGVPPVEIPEELTPYVNAYLGFVRTWSPEWIAVEQMVCSLTHDYAGTFDAFAKIGNERWLLDIKTSSGVYSETALQLAAYGGAEFIGRPGDPVRYRVPEADRFGVIHVVPEGAELIPYAVDEGTFAAFLRARDVWAWTQGPAKEVIGRPLTKEKVA